MGSVKFKDLKAYVRYDGSGRVVAGSLVFRKKKPKNGRWSEISSNLCCNANPSSTTTTTTQGGGGGNTPTAWVAYASFNANWSCQQVNGLITVLYSSTSTLTSGTFLYTDAALTQPYSLFNGNYLAINGQVWEVSGVNSSIINPQSCTGPIVNVYTFSNVPYWISFETGCTQNPYGYTTVYSESPVLEQYVEIYSDQALTQPFPGLYAISANGNKYGVFSGGYLQNLPCITTTTTTTGAPLVAYAYTVATSTSSNQSFACFNGFGGGTATAYATTNVIASVTKFYSDSGLTTDYVGVDGDAAAYELTSNPGSVYAAFISSTGDLTGVTAC